MLIILLIAGAAGFFALAYRFYGRYLARAFGLDDARPTPAHTQADGADFVPAGAGYLLSQHFSAIAAAGPVVGPIAAGLMFGWFPAFLWILLGAVFVGGVHDLAALVASVRHKARSLAEVVREHMSPRAHTLFLLFVWLTLIYVIIAFTDVTATAFVKNLSDSQLDGATAAGAEAARAVRGADVAGASFLYLLLPILMGLVLKLTGISGKKAAFIFVPLIFVCIWAGKFVPIDIAGKFFAGLAPADAERAAQKSWDIILLAYCGVAALLPMWLLLQPRGFLGGFFLYITLAVSAVGILAGCWGAAAPVAVLYPAFTGLCNPQGQFLYPVLFVTVACGACSGFHALVASGTTSRQLTCETDARPVAYGGMLLEGLVALVALATLMMLTTGQAKQFGGSPNLIYAHGIAQFLGIFSGNAEFRNLAMTFGLLAFATFVYDTLDVSTRLGRYILQELTGLSGKTGAVLATLGTLLPAAFFVTANLTNPATGKSVPAWSYFWPLFGTSNQLLAAMTLLVVTVWLRRTGRPWLFAAIPMLFMLAVTLTSLTQIILDGIRSLRAARPVLHYSLPVAGVLLVLALFVAFEAVGALRRHTAPGGKP
ncbi:MAG: carbon starvation CstA family protein [Planctomycetota bacterium]